MSTIADLADGVYPSMTDEEYFAVPAINASALKAGRVSMAHMRHAMYEGGTDSPAKTLGSLTHLAVLEPSKFADVWVQPEFGDLRTKAAKEAKAAWVASLPIDATVATNDDYETAKAIASNVRKHEKLAKVFAHPSGRAECVVVWTDVATGFRCKLKTDWLIPGLLALDLKSCRSASRGGFTRACAAYGYAQQAAWYIDGLRAAMGDRLPFMFGAVESSAPFAVGMYAISEASVEQARALNRRLLTAWGECLDSGIYPAFQPDGQCEEIEIPTWAFDTGVCVAGEVTDSDDHPF